MTEFADIRFNEERGYYQICTQIENGVEIWEAYVIWRVQHQELMMTFNDTSSIADQLVAEGWIPPGFVPQPTGSSFMASDPGNIWVRFNEDDWKAFRDFRERYLA